MLPYRSEIKNQHIEPQAQKGAEEEDKGDGQRMKFFSSPEQRKQDLDKTHKDREKIDPNVKKYMEEKLI